MKFRLYISLCKTEEAGRWEGLLEFFREQEVFSSVLIQSSCLCFQGLFEIVEWSLCSRDTVCMVLPVPSLSCYLCLVEVRLRLEQEMRRGCILNIANASVVWVHFYVEKCYDVGNKAEMLWNQWSQLSRYNFNSGSLRPVWSFLVSTRFSCL